MRSLNEAGTHISKTTFSHVPKVDHLPLLLMKIHDDIEGNCGVLRKWRFLTPTPQQGTGLAIAVFFNQCVYHCYQLFF